MMTKGVTHVIGAGLAGLAAAVRLSQAGAKVIMHEAAAHAGGRCRSFFDPALGLTIDNGNHVIDVGSATATAPGHDTSRLVNRSIPANVGGTTKSSTTIPGRPASGRRTTM